jgi:hypothetical protein
MKAHVIKNPVNIWRRTGLSGYTMRCTFKAGVQLKRLKRTFDSRILLSATSLQIARIVLTKKNAEIAKKK